MWKYTAFGDYSHFGYKRLLRGLFFRSKSLTSESPKLYLGILGALFPTMFTSRKLQFKTENRK